MAADNDTAVQQVVFIDAQVPDLQDLLNGLQSGTEAFVLDPGTDGLDQIADILTANHLSDLASISIAGHGSDGEMQLGSTMLSAANLASNAAALAAIGAALQPGGTIQLYGCDVAQGASGQQFIDDISALAGGATVTAATHLVGDAAGGGSWMLNAAAADGSAAVVTVAPSAAPFTATALANFQGELDVMAGTVSVSGAFAEIAPGVLSATFSDTDTNEPTSDFSGTIAWGDGTTTPFTSTAISGSDTGTYTVSGSHIYAEEGNYFTTVSITDASDNTTASETATTTVAEAQLIAGTVSVSGAVEGVTPGTLSATFSDTDADEPTSDFSGTIDWGDGTATTVTSTAISGSEGAYTVTGSHIYAEEGSDLTTVTITDANTSNAMSESVATTVADAPLFPGTVSVSGAVEEVTPGTLTATFSNADTYAPTSDFSGTIDWGDGATTPFTSAAVSGSNGNYTVSGSHTYAEEGSYTTSVTIDDVGGGTATDTGTATVADAQLSPGTVSVTGAVEGGAPGTLSATFSDADADAPTSDFSGTIYWGDGTATPFTSAAISSSDGSYTVSGSHIYANEGSYTTTVTMVDVGGNTATESNTATVADVPLIPGTVSVSGAVEKVTPATLSATFSNSDVAAPASDFSGAIDWGDGATTPFTSAAVSASGGVFTVSGSHIYAKEGSYTATVTMVDVGGNTATESATATVADAPPTVSVKNVSVWENTSIAASSMIASVSNPGGDDITEYGFYDHGGGSGHFTVGGVTQADDTWIYVTPANLGTVDYVGGSAPGSQTIVIDVYDATTGSYSAHGDLTATTTVAPTVSVKNVAVGENTSIAASSMITGLSNPSDDSITEYGFYDHGGGSGHFTVKGVTQADDTWIYVTPANLGAIDYIGGSSPGSQTIAIDVYDATTGSYSANSHVIATTTAPPTVDVKNVAVWENTSIAASSMITGVSNPSDDSITKYGFYDHGGGSGHFTVGGVTQADDTWIYVTPANLGTIDYIGGSSPGSQAIAIDVYDATTGSYSAHGDLTATTTVAPTVDVKNVAVWENTSITGSSMITGVSNPSDDSITKYGFYDHGGGSGHFTVGGVTQADDTWIYVTPANLGTVDYVGGSAPGSQTIAVDVYDAATQSYSANSHVTATTTVAPTVSVKNVAVWESKSIAAASMITGVSNPSGDSITEYGFYDHGGGSGHFTVGGVTQADDQWIYVTPANLGTIDYVGGSAPGSQTIAVDVYDATTQSYSANSHVTATTTVAPTVDVKNVSVGENASIAAPSMITGVSNPSDDSITKYGFYDHGGGSGHFTVGGVTQADDTWIYVTPANLGTVDYVGGSAAGSQTIAIDVYDATTGSYSFHSSVTATTVA